MFKKESIEAARTRELQNRQSQMMGNLALELGVAGMQVLIEKHGFGEEQAKQWFDAMLARAKENRAAFAQQVLGKAT